MTPYSPPRVTEEVGPSFDGDTTFGGLVFSGQFLTRVHYELNTYRSRSLDRPWPTKIQLGSIELPKYAHWTVLPLDHPVRHSTVTYSNWSGIVVLPSDHPCLTAVHKDELGPSQDPPTTVSPLQL